MRVRLLQPREVTPPLLEARQLVGVRVNSRRGSRDTPKLCFHLLGPFLKIVWVESRGLVFSHLCPWRVCEVRKPLC